MKISENGKKFIKNLEGLSLACYLDVANVKTIGYGHTGDSVNKMNIGDTISKEKADKLFDYDIEFFEKIVNSYSDKYKFTQNEYDALVSFAFNIGTLEQLTKQGTRTKAQISNKLLAYCNADHKFVQGLYNRRVKEKKLFDEGIYE